ncbi:MAG: DUF4178 domain-containing protein [Bryobacteraceae bacterium]|nr:DUF4178 domain-containing protein [Bryobacteraceae bacterium]
MAVRSLLCPNCGGNVELRGMQHTVTAVCVQCLAVLDTKTPSLQVLEKSKERERVQPLIPLGTRGKLHGDPYEAIGFQQRTITVEGVDYSWREYVLFNPYKGFRYLSEYDGHWNDIKVIHTVPVEGKSGGKPAMKALGETFRHFQTAKARTTFVSGEFPWRVRSTEKVTVSDYISPPRLLSREGNDGEVTWSLGEYMNGDDVWKAFQLPGRAPRAKGIFANQPSPYGGAAVNAWKAALVLMGVWLLILVWTWMLTGRNEAYRDRFVFHASSPGEHSLVTPVFELKGRTCNVEVALRTDLENDWAFFSMALINDDTGQAYDFGREVSYYFGRDSDGDWTEGGKNDSVLLPSVPAGRYYLRIEPEMDTSNTRLHSVNYEVIVRRDVPSFAFFFIALPLLLVPALFVTLRAGHFEGKRWQEGDA